MKKVSLKQLRSIIRESVIQELSISPAFQNEKAVESPLEKQNIGKALGDLKRFYRSSLLVNLLLKHKDKYNPETREFDDAAYDQLESLAQKHSEGVIAKVSQVLESSWSEALGKGNLCQLRNHRKLFVRCRQKIYVHLS